MKSKPIFHLLASIFLAVSTAHAATLILHEKQVAGQWVFARTIVPDGQSVAAAVQAIEDDPAQRMGDAFAAVGGAWLQLEEIPGETTTTWEPQPANGFYVFWSVTDSTDPADFHAERFATLPEAQVFLNAVMADPARMLWDQRPFEVQQTYTPTTTTTESRWVITP